MYVKHIKVET